MRVFVVPHDPAWVDAFGREADAVRQALGAHVVHVHHIGSTAIPGIHAKPIIDLLVEATDIEAIDPHASAMEQLGYEGLGECGIAGRRYFRKHDAGGERSHHVHAFTVGSTAVERHLAFRDFMRAHPEDAERYSTLKRELAAAHPDDIEAYMDGKDAFIKDAEARALAWRRETRG